MASTTQHDLPNLTRTAAAREATAEEQPHSATAKKLANGNKLPHSARRSSHDGTPTGKAGETPDYFFAPPARSQSAHPLSPGPSTPLPTSPGMMVPIMHDIKSEHVEEVRRDSATTEEPVVLIKIGASQKQFFLPIKTLINFCPYFRNMGKDESAIAADDPSSPTDLTPFDIKRFGRGLEFSDLDEFAFALFERYIRREDLNGPYDFHTVHHYLGLYIIGKKFDDEYLRNKVMDHIRHYYRVKNMTASPFRLEYIYNNTTDRSDMMRKFLITTAAYRALCGDKNVENSEGGVTECIRDLLKKGGDLAADYAVQLVYLVKHDLPDVRKQQDYDWHMHIITQEEKPAAPEIYEGADEEL